MAEIVLVTGATGYVGSCLIPRLLDKGYHVRTLVRDPDRLKGFEWFSSVETIAGDLLDVHSLNIAFKKVTTAFYLVHNMSSGWNYEPRELESARNFISAAEAANVEHIIYLGGLAHPEEEIGSHLKYRLQTGNALRAGRIPVTEFRSSLIIGSGSISFEMIRYMAEQFPLMIGTRNLNNLTQPISIQDVIKYLIAAMETPASRGRIFEIGGESILTYKETIITYARLRGLTRHILLLPWIPDRLMASVIALVSPVPVNIARPLIGGLRANSIVRDPSAMELFPGIRTSGYKESVLVTLQELNPDRMDQVWQNAGSLSRIKQRGFFIEKRKIKTDTQPDVIFQVVSNLGGKQGWLYMNSLWKMRGIIDQWIGGPGMRGRSENKTPAPGDVLDFYRIDAIIPGELFRLKSEMRAPGLGWMEWRITSAGEGSLLSQTAFFAPKGVWGFIYWYFLWPIHSLVFVGLIRAIARRAKQIDTTGEIHHEH